MKKAIFGTVVVLMAMMQGQIAAPKGEFTAYSKIPLAKGQTLPRALAEQQLRANGVDHPATIAAYKAADKLPDVMHQQPCYCHCDCNHGHKSLHSCFEDTHGASCGTCVQEALYSYKMSKKGWTAKQIRAGITRGEYQQIDLQNPEPVK